MALEKNGRANRGKAGFMWRWGNLFSHDFLDFID